MLDRDEATTHGVGNAQRRIIPCATTFPPINIHGLGQAIERAITIAT
jgi:hypothetical protein